MHVKGTTATAMAVAFLVAGCGAQRPVTPRYAVGGGGATGGAAAADGGGEQLYACGRQNRVRISSGQGKAVLMIAQQEYELAAAGENRFSDGVYDFSAKGGSGSLSRGGKGIGRCSLALSTSD